MHCVQWISWVVVYDTVKIRKQMIIRSDLVDDLNNLIEFIFVCNGDSIFKPLQIFLI